MLFTPFRLAVTSALLATSAVAAPLWSRSVLRERLDANQIVLQFAGVLEALEASFYEQGLAKFSSQDIISAGFASDVLAAEQFKTIQKDETTHLSALKAASAAYGAGPLAGETCTFDFSSALTDVKSFVATARALEMVGVGAYLGGALLITDKSVLTTAAQILTIEARHSSLLNTFNSGSFQAQPFDVSLTPSSVLALASGFITGGCDPTALGLTASPALTVASSTPKIAPGSTLTFTSKVPVDAGFCQMVTGSAATATVLPANACVVPDTITGPVFIYITSNDLPLPSDINAQDAKLIVAGPALAFVDAATPELLAQAIRISA